MCQFGHHPVQLKDGHGSITRESSPASLLQFDLLVGSSLSSCSESSVFPMMISDVPAVSVYLHVHTL